MSFAANAVCVTAANVPFVTKMYQHLNKTCPRTLKGQHPMNTKMIYLQLYN